MEYIYISAAAILILIAAALIFCIKRKVPDIDSMSGEEFERYAGKILEKNGYSVDYTKTSGDYGADLILEKEGRTYAAQCKRYSRPVGVKAVQEAVAAMQYYRCDYAVVISSAPFTRQAMALAEETDTLMWDREFLLSLNTVRAEADNGAKFTFIPISDERTPLVYVDGEYAGELNTTSVWRLKYGNHTISAVYGKKRVKLRITAERDQKRSFAVGFVKRRLIICELNQ